MKISKIFAGMSALAVAASAMSITASASTNSTYMYTVQASWNADAPADKEKTEVKFMYDDNGDPVLKKGATDVNNWDSGPTKFNGQWAQFILTDDNLAAVTVKATIVADADTTWEYHPYDDSKSAEENVYIIFNMFGAGASISETTDSKTLNEQIESANADATENSFYNATGTWEITYSGADLQKAVDDGGAEFGENGDGTYTFGCNIQVGHMKNAKVTLEVTSTENNIFDGTTDESGDSTTDDGDTTTDDGDSTTDDGDTDSDGDGVADSEEDSDGDGVVDSEDDDADGDGETDEDSDSDDGSSNGGSSKGGSSNGGSSNSGSSNSGSTSGGSSSGGSTSGGSSNGGSSNGSGSGTATGTDNSSTGAETMALAGLALAGAAFVVSKKK